jgi:hypothetical protein
VKIFQISLVSLENLYTFCSSLLFSVMINDSILQIVSKKLVAAVPPGLSAHQLLLARTKNVENRNSKDREKIFLI